MMFSKAGFQKSVSEISDFGGGRHFHIDAIGFDKTQKINKVSIRTHFC